MLFFFSLLTTVHAMVGAIDITLGARTCVETELRARTVRVHADRGTCTGVWINDHEVRTAGHCFANASKVSSVRDVEGKEVASGGWVTRVGGQNWSATFDEPDHGEARWSDPVVAMAPVEFADLARLSENAAVVIAGYGLTNPKHPVLKTLFRGPTRLKYYFGTLREVKARRGMTFEVTPVNPRSSIGLGDSGGPAFLVEGCRLKFVGTIVGRKVGLRAPTRVFLRPYTDLPQ